MLFFAFGRKIKFGQNMKTIDYSTIVSAVKNACMEANFVLGDDIKAAIEKARGNEESPTGKDILGQLLENADIANKEKIALCQDTGFTVCFIELGTDILINGGTLIEAINEGVRQGYKEGYLRKSICHPLTRSNTGDNTPAIVHIDLVPDDTLRIHIAPKGGGSENMSGLAMLRPSDGIEGIREFVIDRVKASGGNPCPPIIVGVGIGGTMEKAALIARKALLRPIGSVNPDPDLEILEQELLESINKLGIGPQGLGGTTTALAVHVALFPCHIASLPVAVNINCHSSRHKEIIL